MAAATQANNLRSEYLPSNNDFMDLSTLMSALQGQWLPRKENHPHTLAVMKVLVCGWNRLKKTVREEQGQVHQFSGILDPIVIEEALAMTTTRNLRHPDVDKMTLHYYPRHHKLLLRKSGLIMELKIAREHLSVDIFPEEKYQEMLGNIRDLPMLMNRHIVKQYPLHVHYDA
jgi:hypothetical protein